MDKRTEQRHLDTGTIFALVGLGSGIIAMLALCMLPIIFFVFFMVTTTMKVPPPFAVYLPDSFKRESFPRKLYNVFISEHGQVSVDDRIMPDLDTLELFLASNQDKIDTLIIKADRNAKNGIVVDVMERAKRRAIDKFAIAVKEGEYTGDL